ncbi:MAG: hypothetical protein COB33_012715 [Thiotrichaceae bacterium]|nr:hypothetical protein [Thiotrichaceae bacterium]
MNEVLSYLNERVEEFHSHLSIARMLELRVDEGIVDGNIRVEVRHVNTVKSGLLIHLYNIVEAVTSRTLREVGEAVVTEKPNLWTEKLLSEWIRSAVWNGEDRIGDQAMRRLMQVSSNLASGELLQAFLIKGEPGSWNDDAIKKVAVRLGCCLSLSREVSRAAYERKYRNETTALQYLASKRNAIAHGSSTFEEGANDLSIEELEELSERILPYLKEITESYQNFLVNKEYLAIVA